MDLHGTSRQSWTRLAAHAPNETVAQFCEIFGKMLLVFGCIGSDFCNKICVLQHFQNLPDFQAEIFEIWQYFANFATFAKFLLNFHENCCFFKPIFCENFEIAAVQKDANLVELEKCCQTHIFLQNFVLIQPRTSPPKICKIFENCIFQKCTFFENAFFSKMHFSKMHFSKMHFPKMHFRKIENPVESLLPDQVDQHRVKSLSDVRAGGLIRQGCRSTERLRSEHSLRIRF